MRNAQILYIKATMSCLSITGLCVLHNPVTDSMAEPGGQCLEEKFQKMKINSLCSWQGMARFCFLNGFVS
jgi:hypothetical protein